MIMKNIASAAVLAGSLSLLAPAAHASVQATNDGCQQTFRTGKVPTNMYGDASITIDSDCLAVPNRTYVKIKPRWGTSRDNFRLILRPPEGYGDYRMNAFVDSSTIYGVSREVRDVEWMIGEWTLTVHDPDYEQGEPRDTSVLSNAEIHVDFDF